MDGWSIESCCIFVHMFMGKQFEHATYFLPVQSSRNGWFLKEKANLGEEPNALIHETNKNRAGMKCATHPRQALPGRALIFTTVHTHENDITALQLNSWP